MSKKTFLNTNLDPLFTAIGESIRPIPGPNGTTLSPAPNQNKFTVAYGTEQEEPETEDAVGIRSRRSTIRLVPVAGAVTSETSLTDLIEMYIKQDVTFYNHFTSIKLPENILNIKDKNMGPDMSSYEVSPMFNYISKEYDEYTDFTEESNLPPFWDMSVNQDTFVNFQNIISANTPDKPIVIPYVNRPLVDFPYYNQVRISNRVSNDFSNDLKTIGISANFLAGYVSTALKSLEPFYVQVDTNPAVTEALSIFNVTDYFNLDLSDEEVIYDIDNPFEPASAMLQSFRDYTLALKLKNFSKNFRTYREVAEQKQCYHEDYAYDIKKYRNEAAGNPIQSFLSRADNDTTRLIDTQVKYGMTYVYEAQGHYIILGNQYKYEGASITEPVQIPDGPMLPTHVLVDVVNRPSVIIVPTRLFSESVTCMQPPPIPPKVHFITEINSSREVKIILSPIAGRLYDNFQIILPEDTQQLEKMELAKPPTQVQDGYRFETFNESGLYEIFRMQSPPKDITDFSEHKLNEIRMPFETPNATYTDYLIPNKKYYYMFRKVSMHEMVSNPTSIYEVELVVDADDSKVVVNDFRIPPKITDRKSKTFKSLFQIQPSVENIIFDNTQQALSGRTSFEGALDELTLGIAEHPVWTRKFKFRIRSTTSGKIIDYNITFKVSKDKTQEDF